MVADYSWKYGVPYMIWVCNVNRFIKVTFFLLAVIYFMVIENCMHSPRANYSCAGSVKRILIGIDMLHPSSMWFHCCSTILDGASITHLYLYSVQWSLIYPHSLNISGWINKSSGLVKHPIFAHAITMNIVSHDISNVTLDLYCVNILLIPVTDRTWIKTV